MNTDKHRWGSRHRSGFTLIELLIVIAIIAVLAGLIIGLMPRATRMKVEKTVKTELEALTLAIDSYKEKKGFYPPDNPGNSGTNQLFYELTGAIIDKGAFRSPVTGEPAIAVPGVQGIANAAPNPLDVQSFYKTLQPNRYAKLNVGASDITVIKVPYRGPMGDVNPWHYNSSSPTHNPTTYDLWAEVIISGDKYIIGNWKD